MTTMTRSNAVHRRRPMLALATAEFRQFRRNNTLLYLGTVFPIGVPLVLFFAQHHSSASARATNAYELFALEAVLLVQFYSVLSMVTTRRGEGVLKRLRTGEAADWQIQTAPAVPGAVLAVTGAVVVTAVLLAGGGPAPVNPIALVLALLAGLVIFSLLALASSAMTKNAEAAQMTSIPVIALSVVGLGSIRSVLPDRLATIANWTPFAGVSDLVSLGSAGKTATAGKSVHPLDFAGTFSECGRPLAVLAIWALFALVLTRAYFTWDTRD